MTFAERLEKFGAVIKKATDSLWFIAGFNAFVLFCWIFDFFFLGAVAILLFLLLTLLTQKSINAVLPAMIGAVFIFGDMSGGTVAIIPKMFFTLIIVIECFLPFLLAALVWFLVRNKIKIRAGRFSHGLTVFFVIAIFGGAGTSLFTLANFFRLLLWFAILYLIYLFFYNTVDFKAEHFKRNFSFAFFATAVVVTTELFIAYIRSGTFFDNLSSMPYVGWGIGPTVGQVLIMLIPFGFYLLAKSKTKKEVIIYNAALLYLLAGLFFTRSRAGLLAMLVMIVPLYVITHRKMDKALKNTNLYFLAGAAAVGVIIFAAFFTQIIEVLKNVLKNFGMSGREELWPEGWEAFIKNPIFGNSFFFEGNYPFNQAEGFLYWYWYHNTPLQVLANVGLIGAAAFGYYMYRKYTVFSVRGDLLNFYIFASLMLTEIMSLFDIHIFAFAYVAFMMLHMAAAEHLTNENGEKLKLFKHRKKTEESI